jgi:hypothetical protein
MYSIVQCLFHDQIHKALVSGKKYIPTVDTIYTIIFRYHVLNVMKFNNTAPISLESFRFVH